MDSTLAKVVVGACALVVLAYALDKATRGALSTMIVEQPTAGVVVGSVIQAAERIAREAAPAATDREGE